MQNTEGLTIGVSSKKSYAIWLSKVLLVFVLLVLIFSLAYYGMLVATDNIGTFYSTAHPADLDGDGDLDLLVHNMRQEAEFTAFGGATLWFNHGNGEFVAERLKQDANGGGWASAAGDIDQDGDTDLVVFMGYQIRLLLNQGGDQGGQAGAFRRGPTIAGPERNGQYGSVLMGDLNDDDLLDVVVAGCCGRLFTVKPNDDSPNVSGVWLNDWGSEGWPYQMSILSGLEGLAVREAALGDLDGDGDLDIFAAIIAPSEGRNRNPADRVVLNDGAGNFTDSGQQLGETDSTAVALGDLDNDGDLDALVGDESGAAVWVNQGGMQGDQEGTFALSELTLTGAQTRAVFLADLDGDGDLDALLGGQRQANIWWNDGQAVFTKSRQRFNYTRRHNLAAIEDFNGDGRPDIFAAEYDNDYRIWLNRGNGTFQTTP